jgi:hypothetical protein
MADDDHSGTKPPPVVLRIKLRYDDVETFVDRFAVNIGRAGLFIHSKTPRPVGTEAKFELRLADDRPILVGIGMVKESRDPDPGRPRDASGMMIAFTRVTRESRDLLMRVLEHRKRAGLRDAPGGMPNIDGDRELSGARPLPAAAAESVPVVLPTFESQPVAAVPAGEAVVAAAATADAAGIAAASMAAATAAAAEAVAAVAVAEPVRPLIVTAPLAPEAQRRARPRPQDLIAAAGSAMATTTSAVDDTVDLASVIARARSIITGDLDDELAALGGTGPDATPAPVSADEASNRLAAMLGVAVRRTASRPARAATERAFAERAAAEQAAAERAAAEHAEAERLAAIARAESDRIAAERAEAEQIAMARADVERAEARRLAAEHLMAAEQAEADRIAAARAIREAERAAGEREAERVAGVRAEAERADAERHRQPPGYNIDEEPGTGSQSPLLSVEDDDESTAAAAEPPMPPDEPEEDEILAPDSLLTVPSASAQVARLATPTPFEPRVDPGFAPDAFDDDPDTRYGSEIPGRAKRWMPRLESDIELAIESAFSENEDDDEATASPAPIPTPPPAREGTLDAGFEILSEADAAEVAQAAMLAADPDAMAIPSAIPSESAYRPLDEPDAYDDEPIERLPRPTGGGYSIRRDDELRASSADGTLDYEGSRADSQLGDTGYTAHEDAPLTLSAEDMPALVPERRVPDDFRHFQERYDATPEPIDDFADRLDLESRSVSIHVGLDHSDFNDLAAGKPAEVSDFYIPADDLRSGARDAEDLYGDGSHLGYAAPAADDDLGDLADPPPPAHDDDFENEGVSAPYMSRVPPPVDQVWEGSRRNRRPHSPGEWDRSDVHEAAPEPVRAAHGADGEEEIDLDAALDELDVDLGGDEAPKRKSGRAMTDDGIPIDFDDLDE